MRGNIFKIILVIGIIILFLGASTIPSVESNKYNFVYFQSFSNTYPQDIVYVNDEYNELTPGWNNYTFNNITIAIKKVNNGGTVYVCNGTYNEHLVIGKPLKLVGKEEDYLWGNDTKGRIIDGGHVGNIITVYADDVKIGGEYSQAEDTGFRLINSGPSNGAGIFVSKHKNVEIINNLIFNCYNGIALDENRNIKIQFNKIKLCDEAGIYYIGSEWIIANGMIKDNHLLNNVYGIEIRIGDMFTINENEINGSYTKAIYIEKSWNDIISNNNIINTYNKTRAITINCWNHWAENYWGDSKQTHLIVGVKTYRLAMFGFTLKLRVLPQFDSSSASSEYKIIEFPWQKWEPPQKY